MKRFLFILPSLLLLALHAGAQEARGVCGTSIEDQNQFTERLKANIADGHQSADDRAILYIPIYFHLVAASDGSGRIRETKILEALCNMNKAYAPYDMQFYISPHPTHGMFDKSINNDNVYNTQTAVSVMANRRHKNAINYFITNIAASGNNTGGTTLAYYHPQNDWIVSRKQEVGGAENGTLPHETGHFFSLRHTFYGYEEDPFDPSDPTWPIAPFYAPATFATILTENVDKTNCKDAADLFCDTPPDYNFGFLQSGCAPYNGNALDPKEVKVDPMENNYMSYFLNCANYIFTPDQVAAMKADLNKAGRNYLDNTYTPVSTSITTPTDLLVSPIGGAQVPEQDKALLTFKRPAGATHFFVEIDVTSGFNTSLYQSAVTADTTVLFSNLSANKTYSWRVKPFNQHVGCATVRQSSFKTTASSATNTIPELEVMQLIPNPISEETSARLSFSVAESLNASVSIYALDGRQIVQMPAREFASGTLHSVELPISGLTNGVYLVSMQSENGSAVRKLVINR